MRVKNTPWTAKEERTLLRKIILADTNECMNYDELMVYFGTSKYALNNKIYKLRSRGLIPKVDKMAQFNPEGRPYSDSERKFIIGAVNSGISNGEIASMLERSQRSVETQIHKLIQLGQLERRKRWWTSSENQLLLELVHLDEHNCVKNCGELARTFNVSIRQIYHKISQLRSRGLLPPAKGVSVNALKAFREGNEHVFAKLA